MLLFGTVSYLGTACFVVHDCLVWCVHCSGCCSGPALGGGSSTGGICTGWVVSTTPGLGLLILLWVGGAVGSSSLCPCSWLHALVMHPAQVLSWVHLVLTGWVFWWGVLLHWYWVGGTGSALGGWSCRVFCTSLSLGPLVLLWVGGTVGSSSLCICSGLGALVMHSAQVLGWVHWSFTGWVVLWGGLLHWSWVGGTGIAPTGGSFGVNTGSGLGAMVLL